MTDDEIFRSGSRTYYFASRLFPAEARKDVGKLYSFVRVADNYVDASPQRPDKLDELEAAWQGQESSDPLIAMVAANMRDVAAKYQFDPAWVAAFMHAMRLDTHKTQYETIAELREYIYGSAEVIGLMMSRIMGLSPHLDEGARLQGAAMQLINFIRDVSEDVQLGRRYLPGDELRAAGLSELTREAAVAEPEAFRRYIDQQLARYHEWQAIADAALVEVPAKYRIPVQVANEGYAWTAQKIAADPLSIFSVRHKPSRTVLVGLAAKRLVRR